jgi:branched-chain amino acid aminotransferase
VTPHQVKEKYGMSMADRDGVIWFDGEMVPWREAQVHVLTHTLHYGMGVFEGLRAYHAEQGTAIFRLKAHTDRLYRSAHILGMDIPFEKETLNVAHKAVIRENKLDSAYIRPMCFYGAEGMGLRADNLKVHTIVAAWDWGSYLGDEGMEKGIRIKTSSFTRHHVNITMCKAKANGNYMNSMLALQEALRDGYDEALLLDVDGFVAEGSGENIFIVRNGVIYTPELTSALEGITRDTIFTLAQDNGLEIREKRITRDEVYVADEAFFTGSAAEVTPIRELDGRHIGNGRRGPVTEKLQSQYFDLVHGRLDQYRDWLDYVAD